MIFDNAQQKQLVLNALNAYNVPLGQAQSILMITQAIVNGEIKEDKPLGAPVKAAKPDPKKVVPVKKEAIKKKKDK